MITTIINGLMYDVLSPTEQEVFDLVARGYSNTEISKMKYLTLSAVIGAKTRIFYKLNYSSQREILRDVQIKLVDELEKSNNKLEKIKSIYEGE